MSEEEVIEAYAKFALSGKPLEPRAQAAKLIVQNHIRAQYLALSETLKSSWKWDNFYRDKLADLHRKATETHTKYPTMPDKA